MAIHYILGERDIDTVLSWDDWSQDPTGHLWCLNTRSSAWDSANDDIRVICPWIELCLRGVMPWYLSLLTPILRHQVWLCCSATSQWWSCWGRCLVKEYMFRTGLFVPKTMMKCLISQGTVRHTGMMMPLPPKTVLPENLHSSSDLYSPSSASTSQIGKITHL